MATVIRGDDNFDSAEAGKVLQVVRAYNANNPYLSTTSTSLVASGLTVVITPTKAGNTILIDFSTPMTDCATTVMTAVMYQNGSAMAGASTYQLSYLNKQYVPISFGGKFVAVDTSPITFEVYFRSSGGLPVYLLHANSSYQMTATEILG